MKLETIEVCRQDAVLAKVYWVGQGYCYPFPPDKPDKQVTKHPALANPPLTKDKGTPNQTDVLVHLSVLIHDSAAQAPRLQTLETLLSVLVGDSSNASVLS